MLLKIALSKSWGFKLLCKLTISSVASSSRISRKPFPAFAAMFTLALYVSSVLKTHLLKLRTCLAARYFFSLSIFDIRLLKRFTVRKLCLIWRCLRIMLTKDWILASLLFSSSSKKKSFSTYLNFVSCSMNSLKTFLSFSFAIYKKSKSFKTGSMCVPESESRTSLKKPAIWDVSSSA